MDGKRVRGVNIPVRPRIRELIEYSYLIDAKRIGIAFCAGLKEEAKRTTDILERSGLTVTSVICKCGAVDKTDLQVDKQHKLGDPSKYEAACNPLVQAELLN